MVESQSLKLSSICGSQQRLRSLPARSLVGLGLETNKAKERFGLPEDAPLISCHEAGRDGFWLHRFLAHEGGPAQPRRRLGLDRGQSPQAPRKSDRLDAVKLVSMLVRWHLGKDRVPSLTESACATARRASQCTQRPSHDDRIAGARLPPGCPPLGRRTRGSPGRSLVDKTKTCSR